MSCILLHCAEETLHVVLLSSRKLRPQSLVSKRCKTIYLNTWIELKARYSHNKATCAVAVLHVNPPVSQIEKGLLDNTEIGTAILYFKEIVWRCTCFLLHCFIVIGCPEWGQLKSWSVISCVRSARMFPPLSVCQTRHWSPPPIYNEWHHTWLFLQTPISFSFADRQSECHYCVRTGQPQE